MSKHITAEFRPIVEQLMEMPGCAEYFGLPVDPVLNGAPNYFNIIKHPMDLGTVLQRLERFAYTSVQSVVDDVELVFSNACTYNVPGTKIHKLAKTLRDKFKWLSRKPRMDLSQKYAQLTGTAAPLPPPMAMQRSTSTTSSSSSHAAVH
jgi:hypothetical protein